MTQFPINSPNIKRLNFSGSLISVQTGCGLMMLHKIGPDDNHVFILHILIRGQNLLKYVRL